MLKTKIILVVAVLCYSSFSNAETLPLLPLAPASPAFSTSATANATYPALTFESGAGDGPDVWQIDLTAFDANFLVSLDLTIGDFCCNPDNYEIFWDASSLGETGVAVQKLFQFDTTAAIHNLKIDWLNPIPGGSFYNIDIVAAVGDRIPGNIPEVPLPAAFWLFGTALAGFVGFSKRRKAS